VGRNRQGLTWRFFFAIPACYCPIRARSSRLGDVRHNRQIQGVIEDLDDIQRLSGVSAHAVGLRIVPDPPCAFKNPEIITRAAQIRTHFDQFSPIECAVLARLGYISD
jgi:hypothetical protein